MRDRIDPKSCFSDLSDSLNEMKVPLHFRKNSNVFLGGLDTEKTLSYDIQTRYVDLTVNGLSSVTDLHECYALLSL